MHQEFQYFQFQSFIAFDDSQIHSHSNEEYGGYSEMSEKACERIAKGIYHVTEFVFFF